MTFVLGGIINKHKGNKVISAEQLDNDFKELERQIEEMNSNFENVLDKLDSLSSTVRLLKEKEDEQLSKKRLV